MRPAGWWTRRSRTIRRTWPAAGVALLALASAAGAQEDFRNLDAGRPLRIEDAYPIKYLEWEIQAGARGELGEVRDAITGTVELGLGLFPNTEVAVEVEPAWERVAGESEAGIEGLGAHLLYNFNQESWGWPGFALRLDAEAPLGGAVGRDGWAGGATVIATRSFASRLRVHANGGFLAAADADGGDVVLAGLGIDFPIGLFSRLAAADVFVEVPVDGGDARVVAEAGARLQLSNVSVLDVGIGTRIDEWADGAPNVQFVLGLSRMFGIRSLAPVPAYPDPAIQ